MKKKQRCLLNRFAALVAVLMLCASMCVPCFASNNAASRKWVIVEEGQKQNESGTRSRYLRVVPYENGETYAAVITTRLNTYKNSSNLPYAAVSIWNTPDWWRSDIPLGSNSYVQFQSVQLRSWNTTDFSGNVLDSPPSGATYNIFAFNSNYQFYFNSSHYGFSGPSDSVVSSGKQDASSFFSGSSPTYFVRWTNWTPAGNSIVSEVPNLANLDPSYSGVYDILLQNGRQLVLGTGWTYYPSNDYQLTAPAVVPFPAFNNVSSSQLLFAVAPNGWYSTYQFAEISVAVKISFWIDANKLPAGLQVGDEFPADTDAFDQLRDDLIKQFPEAAENIENGKATLEGWNNTETVDTDVASTSISALNALFQNLGGFLFIVSLMVFGAVVLRMLIRKAVDG